MSTFPNLTNLSDGQLLIDVKAAVRDESRAMARLVALLAEVDARRLHLGEGCASLFAYCTRVLRLSEHAAYVRIVAARAARRYPVILGLLADRSITLTTVKLLAPHLTAENHADVLSEARHLSKRQVEELVARLAPQPDVVASVRKLPSTASPLAPERYKVQLTIGRETYDKLRRVQDLLRHSIPDGDLAAVFERAVSMLLAHAERAKLAATLRARPSHPPAGGSRHIPAAVRREVWKRDGAQCAFVGAEGRCAERGFLEFHHLDPYAAGGTAAARNIELRCRAHNVYEAEKYFGQRWPMVTRERPPDYVCELVPDRVRKRYGKQVSPARRSRPSASIVTARSAPGRIRGTPR